MGHGNECGLCVGLQPFGFAKPRLKCHFVLGLVEAQFFGQQATRLVALAVVGVAQLQSAFWHAVKAHDQLLSFAMGGPMILNTSGQSLDVACIIVVAVDEAKLGQIARFQTPAIDRIKYRCCGGATVLRISGDHQNARGSFLAKGIDLSADAGFAIGHGIFHLHIVSALLEFFCQTLGLFVGPHPQRRAFGGPDAGVLGRRFGRTHTQNNAVQDQPPNGFGNFDNA